MKKVVLPCLQSVSRFFTAALLALLMGAAAVPARARVIDDFNANQASGWEDANPASLPLKGGVQSDGKFTFTLPPIGQSFFVSSRKTSETFELTEGRTVEFRVDLDHGQGPDSFAILAFIPQYTGPNSLGGYGIAKSETDILITKGINKYFYNENPTPSVKSTNVTLVLNLAARGGNVIITGQILDKDDGNRVLWEKTYIDTPAADVLSDGKDDPSAPFIGLAGNFVLYLYADGGKDPAGYTVQYDKAIAYVTDSSVLDDFNAAQRSGWEDANPASLPVKGGEQSGGKFVFALPPVGQSYFVSSKKTTKIYELTEGSRHEFSVDLDHGQGPDSFAILAWIPTVTGPNSLGGYGIAKSETDILVTKGINKYFFNENVTPAVKNENVRLDLTLTVQDGNVIVRSRVFDKSNDAVLFDKTYVDTPAADVMSDGKDDPSAPFITAGNAVLYLYADGGKDPAGYTIQYDNLTVAAPPAAANEPPIISEATPSPGANILPVSTKISFKVSDDKAITDAGVVVTLNGTNYTTANGLTLSAPDAGNSRTATLGGLEANKDYSGLISVTDSDNVTRTTALSFDTFTSTSRFVEVEDYNFDGGSYINKPVRTTEGGGIADNSYTDRAGTQGIDFNETRTTPSPLDSMYRTQDAIRMAHTLDRQRADYNGDLGVYDYDTGDLAAGEWINYTRDFIAGTYEIYLREAVVNLPQAESVLEKVTGSASVTNQTVEVLGSFVSAATGFTFRNVPLTDGAGVARVKAKLSGKVTLRLRAVTADNDTGSRLLNYLVFVPVADAGIQRAAVATITPAANASVDTVTPTVMVTLQNHDTTVDTTTVKLSVNGSAATGATVTKTATGATVNYALSPLPASGTSNTAVITFKDSEGVEVRTEWQFVVRYTSLDPATRLTAKGKTRGFKLHVVQAPSDGGSLENSLDRAENQLATGSSIPRVVDTNAVATLINFNKRTGESAGHFTEDVMVPGIDPDTTGNGDNDFAVEILTYLELTAGVHRFGATTDDGYKVASGAMPIAASVVPIAFYNGGAGDETFDFYVAQAGFYPFRMVWYERAGAGFAEWFSVDPATADRTLINGDSAGAVKAWSAIDITVAEVAVESSSSVSGGYALDTGATVNASARTASIPLGAGNRFFRLKAGSALNIKSAVIQGGAVVLSWQ